MRSGTCGKRQLQQPIRQEIAETLKCETSERYRSEQAMKLMSPDDPEPPILRKSSVLNAAKPDYIEELSLDRDPILAIAKLKRIGETDERFAIRSIGYDPFFVHYWTNHQNLVYKKHVRTEISSLKIGASGKFVAKIRRADGSKSHHIFLYLAVISSSSGQFSVSQMLSEAQDTGAIQNWLTQWMQSGLPPPKETVTSSSRTILTAIVRTFAGFTTIEKYCDAYLKSDFPDCFVRIDAVHFIKMYADALNKEHRLIKMFYLAALGKIIVATDLDTASILIQAVLIVAQSETCGQSVRTASESVCSIHKNYLQNLINEQSTLNELGVDDLDDLEQTDSANEEIPCIDDDNVDENAWTAWAYELNDEILKNIDVGRDLNAHYCPSFAERLLFDIRHLPMWSCLYREQFGYGRIPASSAAVEGEFNKIKIILFNKELRMRADRFVEDHIRILDYQMVLKLAKLFEFEEVEEDRSLFDESKRSQTISALDKNSSPALSQFDAAIKSEAENDSVSDESIQIISADENTLASQFEETTLISNTSRTSASKYIGNDKPIIQASKYPEHRQFPILKNGSGEHGAISKDGHTYTIQSTCAFDSILQVILIVVTKNPAVREEIHATENVVLKLILRMHENGIAGPYLLKMRTNLLYKYLGREAERKTVNGTFTSLDCTINISYAVKHMFRDDPSCEEVSACKCECISKKRTVIPLETEDLYETDFNAVINRKMTLADRLCKKCQSMIVTTIKSTGT